MSITRPPALRMADIDEEIEAALRGEPMDIRNGDLPRSTIVIGAALYAVLCSLMTWNLITTINIKDKQALDIQGVRIDLAVTQGRVAVIESRMDRYEAKK